MICHQKRIKYYLMENRKEVCIWYNPVVLELQTYKMEKPILLLLEVLLSDFQPRSEMGADGWCEHDSSTDYHMHCHPWVWHNERRELWLLLEGFCFAEVTRGDSQNPPSKPFYFCLFSFYLHHNSIFEGIGMKLGIFRIGLKLEIHFVQI